MNKNPVYRFLLVSTALSGALVAWMWVVALIHHWHDFNWAGILWP